MWSPAGAGMLEPLCSANMFPCVMRPRSQLHLHKKTLEMSHPVFTGTVIPSPPFKWRHIFYFIFFFLAFKHTVYNSWSFWIVTSSLNEKACFLWIFPPRWTRWERRVFALPLLLKAGALCHDNVRTTWHRHTQMIPMETLNIKLHFPPSFPLGCHFGSQQPPWHSQNAARPLGCLTSSPDDAIWLMRWLRWTPKWSGKSEEHLSVLCHVSQAARKEFFPSL